MNNFSIAHIGPYPAPFGGVSVHIKRLHERLLQVGIASTVYCDPQYTSKVERVVPRHIVSRKPLCYLNWIFEPGYPVDSNIVHLHYSWGAYSPALLAMLFKGKKIVITVHNQMDQVEWNRLSRFQKFTARRIINSRRVQWIAVSCTVSENLQKRGVPVDRISIIPAFLPPEPLDNPSHFLPENCTAFISAHTPLLSTYGCRFWLDADGIDLYGFDFCIELVRELKSEYPKIGLVLCIPEVGLPYYYEELQSKIAKYGIENNIFFITEPLSAAHALWQLSDLYIRATTTDGDAVAIREALALDVKVVASDASPRPNSVTLFKNRDFSSFLVGVRSALVQEKQQIEQSHHLGDDNFLHLLGVYERFTRKEPFHKR